jgi:hypothetical protein
MGSCLLHKSHAFTGRSLSDAALSILFLSVIISTATMTPIVVAQSLSVTLNPSQGSSGTRVLAVIAGFKAPTTLTISFGTTNVRTITASMYSTLSMEILVPEVSPGTYAVTVTSSTGGVATATFTVTQNASPTPEPAETPNQIPEETPIWGGPTDSPITEGAGFWSPVTVALIAAAIASAGFITFFYIRRGKQEPLLTQDTTPYKPRSPVQETSSYKHSSQVQQPTPHSHRLLGSSTGPTAPARPIQTAANRSQTPTKICRHCKQNVREDMNVCPYCFKRLR